MHASRTPPAKIFPTHEKCHSLPPSNLLFVPVVLLESIRPCCLLLDYIRLLQLLLLFHISSIHCSDSGVLSPPLLLQLLLLPLPFALNAPPPPPPTTIPRQLPRRRQLLPLLLVRRLLSSAEPTHPSHERNQLALVRPQNPVNNQQ